MIEKYTKGPWQLSAPEGRYDTWLILCSAPHEVVHIAPRFKSGERDKEQEEDNARRIVACVNALEHISTEDLESGRMQNLGVRLADSEKQRDELIRAIECAFREGFSASSTYNDILVNDVNEEWEKSEARAAILKATGEQS